ncbi:D-beta-hydroxybutyrate dehydrogenase, mitochondrial-like isoform X1 [Lingula anatina]|uniref:D-beta-hydroxybutyrate dehydrogenase, mitochondrial-like isoform X1 n=1 Tax=Lingula anatina TaxID=7574 RepID=A0A1S3HCH3_LINAN|nr:D-beta-hydroxybutyrate dehydrogenase, mitochondrial-like isoform X1 [Lingula anatina]|eukprot:XP_013383713.1 D-beta-hydroxybutyrate dehydrogenase, mitochondrial-like isoform X1 [Lingula anatina]
MPWQEGTAVVIGLSGLLITNFLPGVFNVVFFALLLLGVLGLNREKDRAARRVDYGNKAVLVTGCDTGLGHELVKRLDVRGLTLFAGCLSESSQGAMKLKEVCSDNVHVLQLDITKDEEVNAAFNFVSKTCNATGKKFWAVVNNAGVNPLGAVEITPLDGYQACMDINLYGMIRISKAFLPLIRKSKGRIVNVTSVKGLVVYPLESVYSCSKFAAECFSDCLRREMTSFGVDVVIVEPGHFGGATAIVDIEKIRPQMIEQWESMSTELKEAYPKDKTVSNVLNFIGGDATGSATDVTPVIDAFEDALLSVVPRDRYLIGGSTSLVDKYKLMAILGPLLPGWIMDRILTKVSDT